MDRRLELHEILCEMFGSRNVYYQPPENIRLVYPCIIYSKDDVDVRKANDKTYLKKNRYNIIVISDEPDHPVVDEILEMEYASYDRNYVTDNLHHESIVLYY